MNTQSMIDGLLGGALVGLASIIVLKVHGRVAGVSGIVGALFRPQPGQPSEASWRAAFVAGLLIAGAVASRVAPEQMSTVGAPVLPSLIAAGLVVGFGTRLGNGCTSGHGVCGISRLSRRSISATLTFMFTAGITVFLARHVLNGVG